MGVVVRFHGRADARADECAVAGTVARARTDRCVESSAHRGATHRAARREEGHEQQARDRETRISAPGGR
jgi:hypothetical protein